MNEGIRNTYDKLGRDYVSPKHQTTEFFYRLQEAPLGRYILMARDRAGIILKDMKVLNVGPGPQGNSRLMTGVIDEKAKVGNASLDTNNITYLEISEPTLRTFQDDLAQDAFMAGGDPRQIGTFLVGDAQTTTEHVAENSQDIVFAGLCDHIPDQATFFSESLKALKPGGALITTYPAKEINTTIREKLYGIAADTTRFVVEGQPHVLPSRLMTPTELVEFYERHGFTSPAAENIMYTNSAPLPPSETIKKAGELMGQPIEQIPILVQGIGFKPLKK